MNLFDWLMGKQSLLSELKRQDDELDEKILQVTHQWVAFCKELDTRMDEMERWRSGYLNVTNSMTNNQMDILSRIDELKQRVAYLEEIVFRKYGNGHDEPS